MHPIIESIQLLLDAVWPEPILVLLAKATLLLLAACVASLALRRATAAVRHMVWSVVLAGLLLLPPLTLAVPGWSVPGLAWSTAGGASQPTPAAVPEPLDLVAVAARDWGRLAHAGSAPGDPQAAGGDELIIAGSEAEAASPAAPVVTSVGWPVRIAALWLAGVLLMLGLLAVGYVRMMHRIRTTVRVTDPEWLRLSQVLADVIGIRRPVALLHGDRSMMPVTAGIVWPVILLPEGAEDWSAERRRAVLLHELAHIRRHDCLSQLLAQLACALFWFHPVVWLAARQMRIERERACDDLVLRFGTRASDYAGFLLEVARSYRGGPLTLPAAVSMARPGQLEGRLLAVLDPRRRRSAPPRALHAAVAVAALLLVVPLAALEPAAPAPLTAGAEDSGIAVDVPEARSVTPPPASPSFALPIEQDDAAGNTRAPAAATDFRWQGPLGPGATVAIHNLSGNIRAVPASGAQAEVVAEKQVRRGNPDDVQIQSVEHAGGITICVLVPHDREVGNRCTAEGMSRRNVDTRDTRIDVHFTVRVPTGVNFVARSFSGDIEGERLPGDVSAKTLSGNVRVSAAGSVEATTLSGTLDVAMERTAWNGTLSLQTMSGTIRVQLPPDASTEVRASTMSGAITTDFPLEVRRRSAEGTLGAGGRRLELRTMSGPIHIERAGAARRSLAPAPQPRAVPHPHEAPAPAAAAVAAAAPVPNRAPGAPARSRGGDRESFWEESMSHFGDWIGRVVSQTVSTTLQEVGKTLGSLGSEGLPHAMDSYPSAELIAMLRDDPEPELRRRAAWALSDRGSQAVEPLGEALRTDASVAVREMAAWSLGVIAHPSGAAALQRAVRRDAAEEVRWSALLSLEELGSRALAPVVGEAAADRSTRIRTRAVWTMGNETGTADVQALRRALRDADAEVRRAAAWASGSVADPALVDALRHALGDGEPGVRSAALWALTQIDRPAAREAVRQAATSDDRRVRQLARGALDGAPWPWPWPWPIPRPRPVP